jgi:hypothetical protein
MALSTYADLSAAILNYISDSTLTNVGDFVALAEAEFNRRLRLPDMEQRSTATLSGDALALPTDFMEMRALHIDNISLAQVTPADYGRLTIAIAGIPAIYTVQDGQLFFKPSSSSAKTIEMVYYQTIPSLQANSTNWLMTRAPDLYLMASLAQAEFYGWNDDRLPMIQNRVEQIYSQMYIDGERRSYGSAPLAPRIGYRP